MSAMITAAIAARSALPVMTAVSWLTMTSSCPLLVTHQGRASVVTLAGQLAEALPVGLGRDAPAARTLLGLLYLIGPGSLLGLTCYVIALRRLPTAAVSTYAYVNPVVAVSLGGLFLGERPTPATLLGGAVVVLSVAMLLIRRTGEPAASADPA
jgi:drug/metabolite transporter (DMT)-like permease